MQNAKGLQQCGLQDYNKLQPMRAGRTQQSSPVHLDLLLDKRFDGTRSLRGKRPKN
jgi:hypothetical protein